MDYSKDVVRCFETLRQMFNDRAKHDPKLWDCPTLDKISDKETADKCLSQIFVVQLENSVKLLFVLQAKFKVADIRKQISSDKISPDDFVVIVTSEKPTSANIKTLKNMFSRMQLFSIEELLINVTKHTLVPLHEVMMDEEVDEIIDRFNIKSKSSLPFIQSIDPVARYLALRPGQVVRITRKSPSAGQHISYRYCI